MSRFYQICFPKFNMVDKLRPSNHYSSPLNPFPQILRTSYGHVLRPEKTKLLTPEINLQTVNFPFSRALPSFLPSFAFLA